MYADVSRAYFYAKAVRPVYVKLPDEDFETGDENMCGRLVMSMYGTRDAAMNWSAGCTQTLIADGYVQSNSNPCLFTHPDTKVMIMVHGDDFATTGEEYDAKWLGRRLKERFEINIHLIGKKAHMSQEGKVLNRVLRRTGEGWEYEADPRHA
jgi:hypothetical protein